MNFLCEFELHIFFCVGLMRFDLETQVDGMHVHDLYR